MEDLTHSFWRNDCDQVTCLSCTMRGFDEVQASKPSQLGQHGGGHTTAMYRKLGVVQRIVSAVHAQCTLSARSVHAQCTPGIYCI